jgi:hypothetical protein
MPKNIARLSGLLLLALTLQVTPALANTQVFVRVGPPAAVVETRPPAPHHGWAWRPGYHRYYHHHYQWVPGAWVAPPHGHHAWVSGHWAHEHRGYYWVNGHWR